MKKILFFAAIITAWCQVKAQQLSPKPSDPFLLKMPPGQISPLLKPGDSSFFKRLPVLPKGQQLALLPGKLQGYDFFAGQNPVNIDHMPILKVNGNIDPMPVATPGGNLERMPVLKVTPLSKLAPLSP